MADKRPVPTRYITEIGRTLSGEPIAIGWDFCRCGQHVVNCTCIGGPFEPKYITAMRQKEQELAQAKTTTTVASTPEPIGVPLATKPEPEPEGPTCLNCNKSVDESNADQNDDGTYTCYSCQSAS